MKRTSLFAFILLTALGFPGLLFAAGITADTDKTQAGVGEEIHLTIRVLNVQGNIQAPRLSGLQGFDIYYTGRSSQMTFVNNQSSSSLEFNYTLIPQTAGNFTIPPIQVQAGSEMLQTAPIQIQVADRPQSRSGGAVGGYQAGALQPSRSAYAPPAPSTPARSSGPITNVQQPALSPEDDPNIFVAATVDKNTAYPNEQILLTYSLYTRYDTRYEGFQDEPSVSGFWIEEFPLDQNVPRETVHMNGKRFLKAEIKKIALFPTSPAEYTINPGTIKASIRKEPQSSSVFDEFFNDSFFSGGSFFARRQDLVLRPQPINIKVVPLPETGKPESFQGALGNFQMTATVDRTDVKQDEPVSLKIIIEGQGNLETLTRPKMPELPHFRTYDADSSNQLFRTGDQIGGRKTFEVVFIPTQSGKQVIPSLEFSYFSPASRSYQRLKTPEFALEVEKSDQVFKLPSQLSQNEELKKDVVIEGKDIHYIKDRLQPARVLTPPAMARILLLFNIGATLFLAAVILRQKQEDRYDKDQALKRRQQARRVAESRMKKLAGLIRDPQKENAFFDEAERILTQFLCDKFNLSTLGITRGELEQTLQRVLGPSDPLLKEVANFYALCDESRFAKVAIAQEQKMRAQKILRDAVRRVEKVRYEAR